MLTSALHFGYRQGCAVPYCKTNTAFMFFTSTDGYIRLTQEQLASLKLVHLISGLDDPAGNGAGIVTGYTEWVSPMNGEGAAISIGWDWQLQRIEGVSSLARIGIPRSNLMMQDSSKADLGQTQTETILATFVDRSLWQNDTLAHLKLADANPMRHSH